MRLALLSTVGASAMACVLLSLFVTATAVHAQSVDAAEDPQKAAVAAHRKAEHERIQRERAAIATRRQHDEAACYQRFSVEDCLRGVRAQVRNAQARLRSQEIELNDAERKEKAAERLRSIEERQTPVPGGAAAPGSTLGAAVRNAPGADHQATKAQREHDAEQRARDQRNRLDAHARDQSARNADKADRAAKARARRAEVLKAAEERRARVEKSQSEAAAAGRKPAARLPVDSTAR